jgi:hypothetical protein
MKMKLQIWRLGLAMFLGLAVGAVAVTYYIDDSSNSGDVWTPTATGNDANDGLTPSTPKLTLAGLFASTNLQPGDVVLIDTGTYATNILIGTAVNGTAGNPILFQGSTNLAAGGTTFTGSGTILEVRGNYLHFRDIRSTGGWIAIFLNGAQFCEFERVFAEGSGNGFDLRGQSNSNTFRRCAFLSQVGGAFRPYAPARGNYLENCVAFARDSAGITVVTCVSNVVRCISGGAWGISSDAAPQDLYASHNIFYYTSSQFAPQFDTLSDFQRYYTNTFANTVADPRFVDAAGLDFHLLSASGFISNNVWVTNPAVGYSPGIDFGPRE